MSITTDTPLADKVKDIQKKMKGDGYSVSTYDRTPEPVERWHSGSYELDDILGGITRKEYIEAQNFPQSLLAGYVDGITKDDARRIQDQEGYAKTPPTWESPWPDDYNYGTFIEEVLEEDGYDEDSVAGWLEEKGITYDDLKDRILRKNKLTREAVETVMERHGVDPATWSTYLLEQRRLNEKHFNFGWPRGCMVEVFGPNSSGKTTIAPHAIAEAQKQGYACAYVDAEHAVDPLYAFDGIGVDRRGMFFEQPDSAEEALDIVEGFVDNDVEVIVVDSVSALVPQAELDSDHGDNHVGLQARLLHKAMRKLKGKVNKKRCTIIWINQIRMKVGVMFGNPETTSGGQATKFYPEIRLRVSPSSHNKEGKETVGNEINARTPKNKTASPHQKTKLTIRYGKGLDKSGELAAKLDKTGAVEKSGSWYSVAGETICQGQGQLTELLDADEDFTERMLRRIEAIESGEIEPGELLPEYDSPPSISYNS
jgi:recombination protein RecA